jgi:hypothetical protein
LALSTFSSLTKKVAIKHWDFPIHEVFNYRCLSIPFVPNVLLLIREYSIAVGVLDVSRRLATES